MNMQEQHCISSNFRSAMMYLVLIAGNLMIAATTPDFYDDLIRKYREFQKEYPAVKLTIITNQPAYVPGDTIFFQAWYTYENFTPVTGNHLVTMDLLDNNGARKKSIRFRVKDGKGYNQMVLPEDLEPGAPLLVAYSDWMKNFNDRWFFKRPLKVVSASKDVLFINREVPLSFKPEGGAFVAGLTTRIAVQGAPGTSILIQDEQKNEITSLTTDSTGFGIFQLTPQQGKKYSARSTSLEVALPQVKADGISITSFKENPFHLELQRPAQSAYADQELLLLMIHRGEIVFNRRIRFQEKTAYELLLPEINPGYYIVYLLNDRGSVIGERILYADKPAAVKSSAAIPDTPTRQTVNGSIKLEQIHGLAVNSIISVSVIQSSLFPNYHPQNIFLLADLPEVLIRLEAYGTRAVREVNDFLITQSWPRTNWYIILQTQPPVIQFPFRSTLSLSGEVVHADTGQPPADSLTMLTYLMNNTMGYETPVRKGKFEIRYMTDFFGEDMAFIGFQTGNQIRDEQFIIKPEDSSPAIPYASAATLTAAPSAYGQYAARKKIIDQSYNYFSKPGGSAASASSATDVTAFEEEYSGADFTVNVNNYVVFNSMKDLIREIVPFVQLREKNNSPFVRLLFRNSNGTRIYDPNPLYCIDGVFTRDIKFFTQLDPAELLRIKVFNNPSKLARMGLIGKNGVIIVESRKGNLGASLLTKNHLQLTGLNHQASMIKQLNTGSPAIPVTSANLYWHPDLPAFSEKTATIRFNTSDDTGLMRMMIWGLTADGIPFHHTEHFTVDFKP